MDFHEQGLFVNFGSIVGRWSAQESRVKLTPAGAILRRAIPVDMTGQMLCFLARRPGVARSA